MGSWRLGGMWSVDFSAFNLQEKRPQLVNRIKALQPKASNRAIAKAIGVGHQTVGRDVGPGPDGPHKPAPVQTNAERPGPDGPSQPEPDTPEPSAALVAQPAEPQALPAEWFERDSGEVAQQAQALDKQAAREPRWCNPENI
jgi:hypothetical protein